MTLVKTKRQRNAEGLVENVKHGAKCITKSAQRINRDNVNRGSTIDKHNVMLVVNEATTLTQMDGRRNSLCKRWRE